MDIPNQAFASLGVNGSQFSVNGLPGMQILATQNVKQFLPTIQMSIDADNSAFSSAALPMNDGTPLDILFHDNVLNQAGTIQTPQVIQQLTTPILADDGTYTFGSQTGLTAAAVTLLQNAQQALYYKQQNNSTTAAVTSNYQPQAVSYRAFGTPLRTASQYNKGNTNYLIHGILDNIPYIRGNPGQAISGTSHDVMNMAAQLLKFSLVASASPQDKMTWLPGRNSWATFLQHVARHAYEDDHSVITHGVDELNQLHFHNLTQLVKRKPIAYIFYGEMQDPSFSRNYICVDAPKAVNRSGHFNHYGAYGQRTSQSLQNGDTIIHNAVNATTDNNSLDINGAVAQSVKNAARLIFTAPDAGNSHDMYMTARHQNDRLLRTYSQNVYALIGQTSGLQLYDLVKFTATAGDGISNASMDGIYFVTGIARTLYNSRYYEKLELTSSGPANQNSALASQATFADLTGAVENIVQEILPVTGPMISTLNTIAGELTPGAIANIINS